MYVELFWYVRFSGSPASVLLEVSLEHLLSLIKLNSLLRLHQIIYSLIIIYKVIMSF